MSKLVVVCNLDSIKEKNVYQVRALPEYQFLFLSYAGPMTDSASMWCSTYPKSIVSRILFVARVFHRHRSEIHHVELYTGNGSFLLLEFLLAKLFGLSVIVAERGALLRYPSMAMLRRFALRVIYQFADKIWLRELWMVKAVQKLAYREVFFCFNAVDLPDAQGAGPVGDRDIDYLWVNSLKPWRNPRWLVAASRDGRLCDSNVHIVGFLDKCAVDVKEEQQAISMEAGPNVVLHKFSKPDEYYRRARFFVLPADIVFLNFALLEAMARGVVPLISDVEGSREIIDHGIDGFVFPHSPEGLRHAMIKSKELSDGEWRQMSDKAIEKVQNKFSLQAWRQRMLSLYDEIGASV